MDKVILHSDLNNFYASCEALEHPELSNLPLAVAGSSEKRHGVVLAKNELAKKYGITTGDTTFLAKRKCPNIVFVTPHMQLYEAYSRQVKDIYYSFTDRVESFGLDECWLDVTGSYNLFGTGLQIAEKIRETIRQRVKLTVSIGVSFTKCYAKIGSDLKKPDAITVISRDNYRSLLFPLPASTLLYVGKHTVETLNKLNIKTIGQLAVANEQLLQLHFGKVGEKLKLLACGVDDDNVQVFLQRPPPKSVGHGTTTFKDMTDQSTVKTVLYSLCDAIAQRLRRYALYANGISLSVKNKQLETTTKQMQLPISTHSANVMLPFVMQLFSEYTKQNQNYALRALSVSTFALSSTPKTHQINLFEAEVKDEQKNEKLEKTLDQIKRRYGNHAVTRTAYLGNDYVLDSFREYDDSLPFFRG